MPGPVPASRGRVPWESVRPLRLRTLPGLGMAVGLTPAKDSSPRAGERACDRGRGWRSFKDGVSFGDSVPKGP